MLQDNDIQAVQKLNEAYRLVTEQLGRVIVGQQTVIEELLIAMFARGHCLLVGVPGLAKTLMIRTLADTLKLQFSRIQFTPDLMPADITGTEVIQEDKHLRQSRLQVSQGADLRQHYSCRRNQSHDPQNAIGSAGSDAGISNHRRRAAAPGWPNRSSCWPRRIRIEHEGTYPLPEAQLDRFMFHILVDYPSEEEEFRIVRQTTADVDTHVAATLSGEQILALQKIVRRVPVADHVIRYALDLVRRTRTAAANAPDFVRSYVQWGAGPRASQYLILGAKARAVLQGRYFAGCDDVRAVACPVLRHRILTNFNAEAEGIKPDEIVRRLIATSKNGDRHGDVFKTAAATK